MMLMQHSWCTAPARHGRHVEGGTLSLTSCRTHAHILSTARERERGQEVADKMSCAVAQQITDGTTSQSGVLRH